jgi:hypothetical protein
MHTEYNNTELNAVARNDKDVLVTNPRRQLSRDLRPTVCQRHASDIAKVMISECLWRLNVRFELQII